MSIGELGDCVDPEDLPARSSPHIRSALRHVSLALIIDNLTDSGCDTPASADKVMVRHELLGRRWRLKLTYPLR
jgi:hypothetical protein